MANRSAELVGCVVSALLCIAQSILFAQFPIKYENDDYYWFLLLFCIPAIIALSLWYARGCHLRHVWGVWLPYIVCLIFTAGVAFGRVGHQLSEDRRFGPHVFEISLCISPLLLFLLLNVASGSKKDRGLAILISFRITLDLFDGIEMLGVTLHKAGNPRDGVPQAMGIFIYTFVVLAFLFSSSELWALTSDDRDRKTCLFYARVISHMMVNVAFMIIRLILWLDYERPAPIFIAKSGISFMVCIIEMIERCCC